MLYKEGIYQYTRHNLSSAHFDSLSPSLKAGSQSEEGKNYINGLHIVQTVDEHNAYLAYFVLYDVLL